MQKPASAVVWWSSWHISSILHSIINEKILQVVSLIEKLIRTAFCVSFPFLWVLMLWFHGLLLPVMMEAIFLFSLQHYPRCTNTYTSNHKHTHYSCCALSWLATFWACVPHGAISSLCSVWKLLISTLSPISAPAQLWQGHTAGILLYWMTEQHASIQLWVKGCGLWFGTKHIKIDYFSPLTAFFLRPSFSTDINQK